MTKASRFSLVLVLTLAAGPGVPPGLSALPSAIAGGADCASQKDPPDCDSRPAGLVPLYAGFIALQALDVHSSMTAVERGARETNPVVAPLVNHPAAFVAFKVGATAGAIYVAEKVRRRSRVGAILLMAALDSAYITVVAHNYRVVQRLR